MTGAVLARTVLAIDGPAGAGKSTVSRLAAERLGMTRLDTGALYRAVTAAVLRDGVDPTDAASCEETARRCSITLDHGGTLSLDGEDVTARIRDDEVTSAVSVVSSHSGVRRTLVAHQRAVASDGWWVVEGRDIGTVVFPDAQVKVFLTASRHERARRRAAETGETNLVEVESDIGRRDALDSSREDSPMRQAPDAVVLDTTEVGLDEVVEMVVGLWEQREASAGGQSSEGMVERVGEEGDGCGVE